MADHVIRMSEEEAARNFAEVLARVRDGAEIVIESNAGAVAVVRGVSEEFRPRLLSQSIALARKHAKESGHEPTLDADFAADLEDIIKSRKPREISSWE